MTRPADRCAWCGEPTTPMAPTGLVGFHNSLTDEHVYWHPECADQDPMHGESLQRVSWEDRLSEIESRGPGRVWRR